MRRPQPMSTDAEEILDDPVDGREALEVRDSYLKDGLREVNRDSRMLHMGSSFAMVAKAVSPLAR